eukprot:TRINITY_DN53757_c0_g2_i1.p1 TRINITY_DN53757_c0_g2~~TRINITY_DN53757_c0_g2_i1.p1  ORF type:complete len:1001 (+),score=181.93 TRINITY_DN53757_c0_g2_i1:27-3005(+)
MAGFGEAFGHLSVPPQLGDVGFRGAGAFSSLPTTPTFGMYGSDLPVPGLIADSAGITAMNPVFRSGGTTPTGFGSGFSTPVRIPGSTTPLSYGMSAAAAGMSAAAAMNPIVVGGSSGVSTGGVVYNADIPLPYSADKLANRPMPYPVASTAVTTGAVGVGGIVAGGMATGVAYPVPVGVGVEAVRTEVVEKPVPVPYPVEVPVPIQQVVEKLIPIAQQQEVAVPVAVQCTRQHVDEIDMSQLEQQRSHFMEMILQLQQDHTRLQGQVRSLKEEKVKITTEISTMTQNRVHIGNQLSEMRMQISQGEARLKRIEDQNRVTVIKDSNESRELQSRLAAQEQETKQYLLTIKQLRAKVTEYTEDKARWAQELEGLQAQHNRLQQQLTIIQQERNASQNDITTIRNENATLQQRIVVYEREIAALKLRIQEMIRSQQMQIFKAHPGPALLFRMLCGGQSAQFVSVSVVERFFKMFNLPYAGIQGSDQIDFMVFVQLFERFTSVNIGDKEAAIGLWMLWRYADMDSVDVQGQVAFLQNSLGISGLQWNPQNRLTFDILMAMVYAMSPKDKAQLYAATGLVGTNGRLAGNEGSHVEAVFTQVTTRHNGLMMLFKFFDESGRGHIPLEDMRNFASMFGLVDIIDWSFVVGQTISVVQFVCMFAKFTIDNFSDQEVARGLRMLWNWADDDHSNKLDAGERLRFMLRLGLKQISYVNKDGDGQMSFDDLWNMVYAIPGGKRGNLWTGAGIMGRHGSLSAEEVAYIQSLGLTGVSQQEAASISAASLIAARQNARPSASVLSSSPSSSVSRASSSYISSTSTTNTGGGSVMRMMMGSPSSSASIRSASPTSTITAPIKTLFTFFDSGRSGMIKKQELYSFSTKYGIADRIQWNNVSEAIPIDEFSRVFGVLGAENMTTEEAQAGLRMLWQWADKDGSGELDATERTRFMLRLGIHQISWHDDDKNGTMNFSEFWNMVSNMPLSQRNQICTAGTMLGRYGALP